MKKSYYSLVFVFYQNMSKELCVNRFSNFMQNLDILSKDIIINNEFKCKKDKQKLKTILHYQWKMK